MTGRQLHMHVHVHVHVSCMHAFWVGGGLTRMHYSDGMPWKGAP